MKAQQNSEKKLLLNPLLNRNLLIKNNKLLEYFPLKNPLNIQKKETSDKTFLKTLTINNQESLASSKNNSLLPAEENKIIFFPKNSRNSNSTNLKKAKTIKNRKKLDKGKKNKLFKIHIENTKKIDYRYYSYYQINNIVPFALNGKSEEEYFWLATYDKLIKKKKLFKIFLFII